MIYQQNFIVFEYSLPFHVTVSKEDKVVEVKHMNGTLVTDNSIISRMKTVDQAFKLIKDAWPHAATVTVVYDVNKGYPLDCKIDESPEIMDEEIEFTISEVKLRE